MSEATLPRAQRSERRPLGGIIWFAWMLAMWAGFFALLGADWIDLVWSWLRELPLLVELLLWVALFPWLLGAAVWTSSLGAWLRVLLVLAFALGWSLVSLPRQTAKVRGAQRRSWSGSARSLSIGGSGVDVDVGRRSHGVR
jgi:hypothetical protein